MLQGEHLRLLPIDFSPQGFNLGERFNKLVIETKMRQELNRTWVADPRFHDMQFATPEERLMRWKDVFGNAGKLGNKDIFDSAYFQKVFLTSLITLGDTSAVAYALSLQQTMPTFPQGWEKDPELVRERQPDQQIKLLAKAYEYAAYWREYPQDGSMHLEQLRTQYRGLLAQVANREQFRELFTRMYAGEEIIGLDTGFGMKNSTLSRLLEQYLSNLNEEIEQVFSQITAITSTVGTLHERATHLDQLASEYTLLN